MIQSPYRTHQLKLLSFIAAAILALVSSRSGISAQDRALVPGTGQVVKGVGDDFEDENWSFQFAGQKSSENIDEQQRLPAGKSANGRWYEGVKRGYPDVVQRVSTPEGGLAGSEGALLLRSLRTGVPGQVSHQLQQDDFICNVNYRLKQSIPVSRAPSFVVRVFLPPVDEWEERSGPHFAVRCALGTHARKEAKGLFAVGSRVEEETYWPGMFLEFVPKNGRDREHDYAYIRIRSNSRGGDYRGVPISVTGWWTFGMSVTPDGRVHYYAKPGIEDLTEADHLASEFPYGYRCEEFQTFFFNVCNGDDGKTWSTPFIVDDASVYVAN